MTEFQHDQYPPRRDLPGGAFALLSPAKINLSLRILGKRPDGFHELDTIFQEVDLCDELEFHPADEWNLEIFGAKLPSDERNLITRAARLLFERFDIESGARVVLHKKIPLEAGLGGGSSNGSIALLGLSRLWKLGLGREILQRLAAELGSDCPFFIHGGMARGRGRGERLELYDEAPKGYVVIVVPGYGISTAWAFSKCNFPLTEPDKNVIFTAYPGKPQGGYALPKMAVNDLENIVLENHPELRHIRENLMNAAADVSLLSGSGSSIFGLFQDSSAAMQAAQQLRMRYTVYVCRMVGRVRSAEMH